MTIKGNRSILTVSLNHIPFLCANPVNLRSLLLLYFVFAASIGVPAMAQETPPPKPAADESAFGEKIARTMTALATSTPEKKNPVRVLFYGQSITAQPWSAVIVEGLAEAAPTEADPKNWVELARKIRAKNKLVESI